MISFLPAAVLFSWSVFVGSGGHGSIPWFVGLAVAVGLVLASRRSRSRYRRFR